MNIFIPTFNQMLFLIILIGIGYFLAKFKIVEENSAKILSRLETYVFMPALVISTFINNFTISKLESSWQFFLGGVVVVLVSIVVGLFASRFFSKNKYLQNIYAYGLSFSNFAFMGNAIVLAIFPEIFLEYLIFVIPFWVVIYAWASPKLLIPEVKEEKTLMAKIRPFLNPMFIAMIVGIILGLIGFKIPLFLDNTVNTLGSCMSPIAMLLTGMTIAKIRLLDTFKNVKLYAISLIRLIFIPVAFIIVLSVIDISLSLKICIVCAVSMPLGLNSIVIPESYGMDTKDAAGMALISHLISLITIPLVLMMFQYLCF